jgi:EmrB/QacA subfamily drug resistance transporter
MTDTATRAGPPPEGPSRMSRWQLTTVLTVLLSGQLLSALEQTIVGTALPTIVGDLGNLSDLALIVTAYLLTSTVATAVYGKLADLYGPKPMYLSAIGIFTGASLLVGLSQNMGQLVAFRALQGIGGGGLVVLAFTICASVLPPRQLGKIQGLVGAMYALAAFGGPLLGGAFTQHASWRWCFLINVPVGIAGFVAVAGLLRLPPGARRARVDYLGAALLVAGVSVLTLLTFWGGSRYGWTSAPIVGLFGALAVVAALFVLRERSAPEPLTPPRLLRNPEISLAMVITFVSGVAMLGAYVFLPVYLQVVRGDEPTTAGLQLLPLMIAVMVGSGASGWLVAAVLGRMKLVILLGTGIMTLSLYLFSRLSAGTPVALFWAYEVVMGIGLGMVISKLIIAVQNRVDRRDLGTITAQAAFFRIIGAAIGTAVLGAVLASRLAFWQVRTLSGPALDRLPGGGRILYADPASIRRLAATDPALHGQVVDAFARSLHTVFLVATPIMAVAFLLTFFLPNTRLRAGELHAAEAAQMPGADGQRPGGQHPDGQHPGGPGGDVDPAEAEAVVPEAGASRAEARR